MKRSIFIVLLSAFFSLAHAGERDYSAISIKKSLPESMYETLSNSAIEIPKKEVVEPGIFDGLFSRSRQQVAYVGDLFVKHLNERVSSKVVRAANFSVWNDAGVYLSDRTLVVTFQPEIVASNILIASADLDMSQRRELVSLFMGKGDWDSTALMHSVLRRDDLHRPEGRASHQQNRLIIEQALAEILK